MHIEDPAPLTRDHFGKSWVGIVSYYIFHWRNPLLAVGVVITIVLGWSATRLEVQAGFSKMLPLQHPYMQTFLKYQQDFGGASSTARHGQRSDTVLPPPTREAGSASVICTTR